MRETEEEEEKEKKVDEGTHGGYGNETGVSGGVEEEGYY